MRDFDFPVISVREGSVEVFVPVEATSKEKPPTSRLPVFYNPIMSLNRDFAVLVLQAYQSEKSNMLVVCEPLAGCGVRGIRFAKEVEGINRIVLNDLNPKAYNLIIENVRKNMVEDKVEVYNEDANFLLAKHVKRGLRFDVIDIDPFGSPSLYLDLALRALKIGGLLSVTATDMAVLCGIHKQACIRHYWAKPLRTEYCHELAARILLASIAFSAAKMDLAVKPIFTHSTDHYIRVYVEVFRGAKIVDESLKNDIGYILHCFNCLNRKVFYGFLQKADLTCDVCGRLMKFAGPVWLGKLWARKIVEKVAMLTKKKPLSKPKRIMMVVEKILAEIDSPPTYYTINTLCDLMGKPTPPLKAFLGMIKEAGFNVTLTHFNPQGFKTDAPVNVLKKNLLRFFPENFSTKPFC
ncbi:MAG: tRNA (guanine(10)-N(2))-dimethyltransferase [Candidatus Bathyarchaeota archaeon]